MCVCVGGGGGGGGLTVCVFISIDAHLSINTYFCLCRQCPGTTLV